MGDKWQMQIVVNKQLYKRGFVAKGVIRLGDGFLEAAKFRAKSSRLARVGLKKKLLDMKEQHNEKHYMNKLE